MNLKNLFKAFKKEKQALNPIYQNAIPASISYKQVKQALQNESLSEVIATFEFFKRFDTQISSEIGKRKMQVVRLPLIVESKDKAQDVFLKELVNKRDFRKLLFECSSSLMYGFSSFVLNWESKDSKILPKPYHISHRYFDSDMEYKPYIIQGSDRIYLDSTEYIYTLYHPSDTGNIIESSLMNKIVSLASLKHVTITRYMQYLDSFAVPPLIIKSDALNSKETSDLLLKSALNLRSNGVGLFSLNDILEVLHGNVDKGTFLEFIRYCDECLSKIITGQVLAGNSVQNGTQALGLVHEGIARNILEYDASILSENLIALLTKTLELNFAKVAPFSFSIDTNTEKDEKLQAEVYNLLSNMGITIPIKHLENTFKIEGLEYKEDNFMQNFKQGLESNKDSLDRNKNATQTKNEILQNKTKLIRLPATKLDKELDKIPIDSNFDIEEFIKDCETYEEASQKIYQAFSGEELLLKEQELLAYMLQANLYGIQKGSKNRGNPRQTKF